MQQINGGKWLDPAEAAQLRDELFYQNAIQAYLRTLPAAQRHRHARRVRGGVRRRLQRAADLEGTDGLPHLGPDPKRRRHLLDELPRPEGDRPARRRRAAERHRHVH
jgi:hypothetical protein